MTKQEAHRVADVALIFEGGGMRASYTSAVVRMLLETGIQFPWVAGVSAGASNTVNYLSGDAPRAERSFVDFVTDPQFGGVRSFARGKGFFNAEYIYEGTSGADQALPFDFARYRENPAESRIGAFECDTGRTVYWSQRDVHDVTDVMRQVRASSTMPLIMPPVHYRGHVYVDGALGPSGGIALDAAIADGFTRFFVVLTQPRDYHKGPARGLPLIRRHFRHYPAVSEALANRPRNYNRTRQEVFDLERAGAAYVFAPRQMRVSNHTRDLSLLRQSFADGLAQSREELPRWCEFLGIRA